MKEPSRSFQENVKNLELFKSVEIEGIILNLLSKGDWQRKELSRGTKRKWRKDAVKLFNLIGDSIWVVVTYTQPA